MIDDEISLYGSPYYLQFYIHPWPGIAYIYAIITGSVLIPISPAQVMLYPCFHIYQLQLVIKGELLIVLAKGSKSAGGINGNWCFLLIGSIDAFYVGGLQLCPNGFIVAISILIMHWHRGCLLHYVPAIGAGLNKGFRFFGAVGNQFKAIIARGFGKQGAYFGVVFIALIIEEHLIGYIF